MMWRGHCFMSKEKMGRGEGIRSKEEDAAKAKDRRDKKNLTFLPPFLSLPLPPSDTNCVICVYVGLSSALSSLSPLSLLSSLSPLSSLSSLSSLSPLSPLSSLLPHILHGKRRRRNKNGTKCLNYGPVQCLIHRAREQAICWKVETIVAVVSAAATTTTTAHQQYIQWWQLRWSTLRFTSSASSPHMHSWRFSCWGGGWERSSVMADKAKRKENKIKVWHT